MKNKEAFVRRADEHIHTANDQLNQDATPGEVSASFMYGVARFNAWLAACDFESANDMRDAKAEVIEYFAQEYKKMLSEHIDNHIEQFNFTPKN